MNDMCAGRPEAPTCRLDPQNFADALPTPEIVWGGTHDDPVAPEHPFSPSTQVVMTPLVANMNDDNGDGLINTADTPDLVFLSFCGSSFTRDGILRIVHGGGDMKGMDAVGSGPKDGLRTHSPASSFNCSGESLTQPRPWPSVIGRPCKYGWSAGNSGQP